MQGRWTSIQIALQGINYLGICLGYIFLPLLHFQDKETPEVQSYNTLYLFAVHHHYIVRCIHSSHPNRSIETLYVKIIEFNVIALYGVF